MGVGGESISTISTTKVIMVVVLEEARGMAARLECEQAKMWAQSHRMYMV